MSVKYTKVPLDDNESGLVFDYSSPFSYEDDRNWKYRSAFKYTSSTDRQVYSNLDVESTQADNMFSVICHKLLTFLFIVIVILTFPISVWFSFKMIPNYQKVVVFRLGHMIGVKGPGVIFVIPCIDRFHKVDVRIRAFNVPPKQIITSDGAIVEVGADVQYRIGDVKKSVTSVQNLDQSTRILVQTTLLKHLARKKLSEIECQRSAICSAIQDSSNEASMEWGVEITRIELSQVKVIRGPPASAAPKMMFPPGMMMPGSASQSFPGTTNLPPAFQQLASAFMASQGNHPPQPPAPQQPMTTTAATSAADATNQGSSSPTAILQAVQSVLTESLVQKVGAVYQFQVTGENGGVYYLDLKHGRGSAGPGMAPNGDSDATLMMSVEDLQAMFVGEVKPLQAYMSGRLKAAGDLEAAMRLEEVVKKITGKS